jgi:YggT family protein
VNLECLIDRAVVDLIRLYSAILIVYAVVSWLPDLRGRWTRYLAMLVEPVLNPIRRVIPPVGGLDLAFLVLILVLNFVVAPLVSSATANACYY